MAQILNHDQTNTLNALADDRDGPVALHRCQTLIPVEGLGSPIFPPTYAPENSQGKPGYNIDELSDGTRVATIDSVGSQANRMEPVFLRAKRGEPENPRSRLVPQIDITYSNGKSVSILEIGHRLGDALIRSTCLKDPAHNAFSAFLNENDASELARIAPTSLVFGVWDSRDTGAKLPRIVQSTIRAENVEELTRSAQYSPPLDYAELGVISEVEQEKQQGNPKSILAKRGFVHVPSVRTHGGVIAHGSIQQSVTVNLIALRRLDGQEGRELRRYILGLALVAATAPMDGFLRSGCLLSLDPENPAKWYSVARSGSRCSIGMSEDTALAYAQYAAGAFGVGKDRTEKFDKRLAKADTKKK
ncbi:MAG: type I-U CRISPR-associated RAMP protein Csb1/Cas7u [Bryobacterales bacterium]|nr:type I-U CRISPR-associated RAMP protein Csb1/Cas7u [Bryobacterales bacterium]